MDIVATPHQGRANEVLLISDAAGLFGISSRATRLRFSAEHRREMVRSDA
jgi:hypothetical protein